MAWLVFVVSGDGASFRRLKMAVCKFLLEPNQPHVPFHWFPSIGSTLIFIARAICLYDTCDVLLLTVELKMAFLSDLNSEWFLK